MDPVSKMMSRWSRAHAETYTRSGGLWGRTVLGRPIVVVTVIGARTGASRKVPLMRVEHDGEYAIVASLGGAPKHPVWYWNVRANPQVLLQDGSTTRDYLAREVTGDEKTTWWERAVDAFPEYDSYQQRTSREIPVFVLTPVEE